MNGAVFLDRDNTIIHNDGDLGDPAQVRLIQGAASAIASLKGLNYRIIVVTNQGGVARGKFTEADVDRVNERINELIRANSGVFIDRFYYCPYHPEGTVDRYRRDHPWRKPRPGMLLQAARDLGLDLRQSWMIGDQMRDVQAGFSAGVVPILLSPEGGTPPLTKALPPGVTIAPEDRGATAKMVAIEPVRDFFVVRSLIEAVRLVGQKSRPTNVTAAMKTERVEVVAKAQPRVGVGSFDPPAVTTASDLDAIPQTVVIVNEAATQDAAIKEEASVTAKRRPRSDRSKHAKDTNTTNTSDGNDDEAISSTSHVIQEIESKAKEELLLAPVRVAEPDGKDSAESKAAEASRNMSAPESRPSKASNRKQTQLTDEAQPTKVAIAPILMPAALPLDLAAPSQSSTATLSPKKVSSPATTSRESKSTPGISEPAAADSQEPSSLPSEATSSATPGSSPMSAEQTLRQILQELRSQRKVAGEFTYAGVMAIVLQMVAGVCLLAGLLMGSGDDGLFLRWMACAVLLQLATLAMLLFRKT